VSDVRDSRFTNVFTYLSSCSPNGSHWESCLSVCLSHTDFYNLKSKKSTINKIGMKVLKETGLAKTTCSAKRSALSSVRLLRRQDLSSSLTALTGHLAAGPLCWPGVVFSADFFSRKLIVWELVLGDIVVFGVVDGDFGDLFRLSLCCSFVLKS